MRNFVSNILNTYASVIIAFRTVGISLFFMNPFVSNVNESQKVRTCI
jgi:hypothetical protein